MIPKQIRENNLARDAQVWVERERVAELQAVVVVVVVEGVVVAAVSVAAGVVEVVAEFVAAAGPVAVAVGLVLQPVLLGPGVAWQHRAAFHRQGHPR